MTLEEICLAMREAERRAGELILHAHGVMTENKSGARDVVTQYDRAVQQLLIWNLRAAVPEAHFFCEEMNEQESLDAAQLFIIDPIDGTMNFVRGFSHSCVSVAYAENGVVQAAAVYNPYLDEMFHAVRGGGAFLNESPIRTAEDDLAPRHTAPTCRTTPLPWPGGCSTAALTCGARARRSWICAAWPRAARDCISSWTCRCGITRRAR